MALPNALTVFDMFCGCGGLSLGLAQAGMNIQWANECWHEAAETYKNTHMSTSVFEEDAQKLFARMVNGDKSLPHRGDVDVLVGGPPCQGFSGYNRYRSPEDPRNSMVEVFLDYIDYLRPRLVLMENVPGLLSTSNGALVNSILTTIQELGYRTRLGILQAGNYGLPQNRWRVFVLAVTGGVKLPTFPVPTHHFPNKTVFGAKAFSGAIMKPPMSSNMFWKPEPMVTVADGISDLPRISNGGGEEATSYTCDPLNTYQIYLRNGQSILYDHICVNLSTITCERIRAIPKKPGAGWLDLPDELKPKNLVRHGDNRYPSRFGRLHWKGTFTTILSRPEPYWARFIHPEQDRVVSVRECARAQGFPDQVRFFGTMSAKYKQIGNAVPPILAKEIGLRIIETIAGA